MALMGIPMIIKNTFRKYVHLPAVGNMLAVTMLSDQDFKYQDFK